MLGNGNFAFDIPPLVADWTEDGTGLKELGRGRHTRYGIVREHFADGSYDYIDAYRQPRNFHISEGDPYPGAPNTMVERRMSHAIIAEDQNAFRGFVQGPKVGGSRTGVPFLNDWTHLQRSTRVVDYEDPKGRTALTAQGWKVIDDHRGEYSLAIPLGPVIVGGGTFLGSQQAPDEPSGTTTNSQQFDPNPGGSGFAGAGLIWDGLRNGLTSTFFATVNPNNVYAAGREGTEYGVLSARRDAQLIDWAAIDQYGSLHSRDHDLTNIPDVEGFLLKGWLGFDPTVRGYADALGKENCQWRPICPDPFHPPPDETVENGTPGTPVTPGTPLIPNPGGDRPTPHGGGPSGNGKLGGGPTTGGGGTQAPPGPTPVGFDIFYDGMKGWRLAPVDDVANSYEYNIATRMGVGSLPDVTVDPQYSGGRIGDAVVLLGQGPNADRSVWYVTQGDGTVDATWGMVLPSATQIGVNGANSPYLVIGEASQSPHYRLGVNSVDGNFEIGSYDGAGAKTTGQQVEFFTDGIHHNGAATGANSHSWNSADGAAGGFSQIPVHVITTTPGDAEPGGTFGRKRWTEEIDVLAIAVGPMYDWLYTSDSFGPYGNRYHANPNAPIFDTRVDVPEVRGPLANDLTLVTQYDEGGGTPNDLVIDLADAPLASGGDGGSMIVNLGSEDGAGNAGILSVIGDADISGKLTVDFIDPRGMILDKLVARPAEFIASNAGIWIDATGTPVLKFWDGTADTTLGAGGGGGYDTIQEEGVNLTQRTTLDFVGGGFTASDTGAKTQVALDTDLNAIAAFAHVKGNLIADTGAVWTTVGSVTNGQHLVVDTAQSTGLDFIDPAWELLERKEVSGSAVQSLTFSGLNGNTDGFYMIIGHVINDDASTTIVTLEPNGLATNQDYERAILNAGVWSLGTGTTMEIARCATGQHNIFQCRFYPATGQSRPYFVQGVRRQASGDHRAINYWGGWEETSTNVTSIDIQSDVASGIGIGTVICLYRLKAMA